MNNFTLEEFIKNVTFSGYTIRIEVYPNQQAHVLLYKNEWNKTEEGLSPMPGITAPQTTGNTLEEAIHKFSFTR